MRNLLLALSVAVFSTASAFPMQQAQLDKLGLQVVLVPEKDSFTVGDALRLSFIVRNNSTEDLEVIEAADTFNWLYRPERFTLRVERSDGIQIPIRPLPSGRPGGNRRVGPQKIPAKGSYTFSLSLPDWVELKESGVYTIIAARTLDIGKYTRDRSWQNPANLQHIDAVARAQVSVLPR